jgi:hypothetical protein
MREREADSGGMHGMLANKCRSDDFVARGDAILRSKGFQIIPEESLKRIGRQWPSRPDSIIVHGNIIYQEELKRPDEFDENSWLSTYTNDPIADARRKWRMAYDNGTMSREETENRIIITEADDHFAKRTVTWDYPDGLDLTGKTEKLVIRYPDDTQRSNHLRSLMKILSSENRHPAVICRNGGQILICFDPP